MVKFADEKEKVNKIIDGFILKMKRRALYPITEDRIYQYAMAILCRAKGESRVMTKVDISLDELSAYSRWTDDIIKEIREICGDNTKEILPACADVLLAKYNRAVWGEYMQPLEITEVVMTLMREHGSRIVYNPFAGLASYAFWEGIKKYYGQEINHSTCNLAKMRMELNGIDYSNFECSNSIANWNDHNADTIVSTPPFGFRTDTDIIQKYHASTAEEFLLSKFINGKAKYGFFVVSRGVCFKSHGTGLDIRKDICDKHLLEMVINLPSGIFSSTGISTSLIVLNRCRRKEDKVTFVDAEFFFKTKHRKGVLDVSLLPSAIKDESLPITHVVSYQELYENDCSFDLGRYALPRIDAEDGQKIYSLGDLLVSSEGERCDFTGEYVNNVIESSNFANTFPILGKDVDNRVFVDKPKYKFHGPHIVFNMQGKIYVHRGDTDFYIGTALRKLVFKVNETIVDKLYLAMILLLNDVLQRSYFGAGMARINTSHLLKYKVAIEEDLAKQRREVKYLMRNYLKDEKKRVGIREAGGDLTHMLGMPKDQINNLIEILSSSETLSNDDKRCVKAIDDNFRYMLRLINTVGVDFATAEGTPEEFKVTEMLGEYVESLKNLKFSNNYKIEVDFKSSDDVAINCDIDFVRVILDSAFRNAYVHGFEKKYSENNMVKLGCKVVDYEGRNYVCITVANNGIAMDPAFTTEDYATMGKKAGKMGNTGKGGYHIYAIAKRYDGYIRTSSSKEWPFILDVLIPAENWSNNEIIEEYGSKCL